MRKTALVIVLIIIVGLISLGVWYSTFQEAIPVRLAQVQLVNLHSSIKTNGKAEAERIYEIRSPMPGICREILAREGDSVTAGQSVLVLDEGAIRSELARAQSELFDAHVESRNIERGATQEELNQAQAEVGKYRLEIEALQKTAETNEWLFSRNAISRLELEESRRVLERARHAFQAASTHLSDLAKRFDEADRKRASSRVDAARARIQVSERSLALTVVRAPAPGTLYQFEIKNGAYVNTGDLIGYVADLKRMRVRAYVDEPELGRVRLAAEAIIRWDGQAQTVWKGKVSQLPSQIVARGTRSVAEILCTLEEGQAVLRPNVNVDVEIVSGEGLQVAALPRTCVFPEGKDHFVWVLRDGKAMKRSVQTGRSSPTTIEITGGINVGERVITPGELLLTDGVKIRVLE